MNRIEVALESHRFCLSHNRVLTGEVSSTVQSNLAINNLCIKANISCS